MDPVIGIGMLFVLSLIIALMGMPRLQSSREARRVKNEENARAKKETARIAALPKLDTSRMLEIEITPSQVEESKSDSGKFGSRYVHMYVVDRDGRNYLCFMTFYNLRALWKSRFKQGGFAPLLTETESDFYVDGVRIGVHPTSIRRYPRDSIVWRHWAQLHREFDEEAENHFRSFKRFFDLGEPRNEPLLEKRLA